MRFGCVIVPGEAAQAKAAGFDYVEMAGKAILAMDDRSFSRLLAELDAAQIGCRGLNAYCPAQLVIAGEGWNPRAATEYARSLLPRARQLGIELVGIGSPFSRILPDGYDRALAFRQAAAFFQRTGEVFSEAGIRVCVEALGPCYCNFINRLSEALALAGEVELPNVGVVLDFYNMEHVGEADDPLPEEALMARVFHAHISDDDGSPQRRYFLRPDEADKHIRRVRGLIDAGYQGDLTLEIDLPLDARRAKESLAILRQAASMNA